MNLLALELSSRRASVALFRDGHEVAAESWDEAQARHQHVFEVIPALLAQAGLALPEIDVFGAGRGPGAFSGIRIAITAVRTLALPGNNTVMAVSSGEALARAVADETSAPYIVIAGDARRGTVWYGIYDARDRRMAPWSLTTVTDLPTFIPANAVIASPDWDRLAPLLTSTEHWLTTPRHPTAQQVAACILDRMKSNRPSDPIEPIYMHPAV